MKTIIAAFGIFAFGAVLYTAVPADTEKAYSGLCVTEYNASFNSKNSVPWIEELTDCKGMRVDIIEDPTAQMENKIVVVPTIIIFNEGEEVKRYQANIMMECEVTQAEIQVDIDEIILSEF